MTTAIELDQLRRLEQIVIRAREGGRADLLADALRILGQMDRLNHPDPATDDVRPDRAEPRDARVRAGAREPGQLDDRQLDGLNKLKQGRDQCTATRRDGDQCQAPAIEGHIVCRRHGGSAFQVAIKAKYVQNLTRVYAAQRELEEALGTPREFDALCRASIAERDLEAYQVKRRLLREFRAGLAAHDGGRP